MKWSTALTAVVTSAATGVVFALLVPITSMIVYVITGVNIHTR